MLGCGNVGTVIAKAVRDGKLESEIGALYDQEEERALTLAKLLDGKNLAKKSFDRFLDADMELVVESASPEAVRAHGKVIVDSGRDMIVLSVGALMDKELREEILDRAKVAGARIYAPSGAIGGLDALRSASVVGFERVVLTTTKNPRSIQGNTDIHDRTVIYEGHASDAVRRFPKNINVAAAVALASGTDPEVRLVADPEVDTNIHHVQATGGFGSLDFTVSNLPSPDNPKTSYLAALSVIRTIEARGEILSLGT